MNNRHQHNDVVAHYTYFLALCSICRHRSLQPLATPPHLGAAVRQSAVSNIHLHILNNTLSTKLLRLVLLVQVLICVLIVVLNLQQIHTHRSLIHRGAKRCHCCPCCGSIDALLAGSGGSSCRAEAAAVSCQLLLQLLL